MTAEAGTVDTRQKLTDAIREHAAAMTDGGYMVEYVVVASVIPAQEPDACSYVTEVSDGPLHHRAGLLRYATVRCDQLIGNPQ